METSRTSGKEVNYKHIQIFNSINYSVNVYQVPAMQLENYYLMELL